MALRKVYRRQHAPFIRLALGGTELHGIEEIGVRSTSCSISIEPLVLEKGVACISAWIRVDVNRVARYRIDFRDNYIVVAERPGNVVLIDFVLLNVVDILSAYREIRHQLMFETCAQRMVNGFFEVRVHKP